MLCSAGECCSATVEPHLERFVVRVQGWFDATEPSLCTAVQGKQGVPSHLVGIGSKRFNVPYLVPKNPVHTGSCSKESNHEQTTLTAACLGCTEVRRGSKESNHMQTTLSAECSDCAKVRRGSKRFEGVEPCLDLSLCSLSRL